MISDNTLTDSVFCAPAGAAGEGAVDLFGLTISGNTFPTTGPIFDTGNVPFILRNSIVDEPERTLGAGADQTFDRVMVNTPAAVLPEGVFRGVPIFNYIGGAAVQTEASPGVDAAICDVGAVDGDGNPRNVDLPEVNNGPGPCDLGAFETPASAGSLVFRDGFE